MDGSAEYGNAMPVDDDGRMARVPALAVQDSNFAAYPAVALWHRAGWTASWA